MSFTKGASITMLPKPAGEESTVWKCGRQFWNAHRLHHQYLAIVTLDILGREPTELPILLQAAVFPRRRFLTSGLLKYGNGVRLL